MESTFVFFLVYSNIYNTHVKSNSLTFPGTVLSSQVCCCSVLQDAGRRWSPRQQLKPRAASSSTCRPPRWLTCGTASRRSWRPPSSHWRTKFNLASSSSTRSVRLWWKWWVFRDESVKQAEIRVCVQSEHCPSVYTEPYITHFRIFKTQKPKL